MTDKNEVVTFFSTLEQNMDEQVCEVDIAQKENRGRTESRRQAIFLLPSLV